MTTGSRIKQRRMELGMTQQELADKLGYSNKSSITKLESGDRNLSQPKLLEIAKVLNVTPDYLCCYEDHSKDDIEVFGFNHALNAFKRFEKYMEYLSPDDLDEMEMLCKHKAEKNKKSKVITVYNPEGKNNE